MRESWQRDLVLIALTLVTAGLLYTLVAWCGALI